VTRRALGRGRLLVSVGAILALVGMVPAWWLVERTNLPALSGNGFQGPGIVVFLATLALLALIVLPFASRDGDSSISTPSVFVIVAVAAIGAFLWRVYEISQFGGLALPQQAPGLWLTGLGLLAIAWGVGSLLTERPTAY